MVNQWGRDGNFTSGGSRSPGSVVISVILAVILGAGGGYAGARFFSGVSTSDLAVRDQKIAELQQSLSEMKFDNQGADTQETALRQRVKDLQQQVDAAKKSADQRASQAGDDAKAEIAALRKTIEEAGDLSKQLNRARKSQKVSELQIVELEQDLSQQKAEVVRLQSLLDKRGDSTDTNIRALNDQIKMLQSALSSAKKQIAEMPGLKRQIADLEDRLAKRTDDARKQIQDLQKQRDLLQARLDDALASSANADAKAKKLAELQRQLDSMAESLADRDQAVRDAARDLKQAKAALDTSSKQLKALQSQNDALSSARADLDRQVASLNATIAQLKASNAPVDETQDAADQPGSDTDASAGMTPRDRGEVERAVADLPGYGKLRPDRQDRLIEMLVKGECVTDSLKAAYGNVSAISLRRLFRDLGGRC